jgi:hypothetical protein
MSPNRKLIELLDREFRRLEDLGEGPFTTVQSKAQKLGIEPTYLSKLRSGDRVLTKKQAQLIAAVLRPGASQEERIQLEDELLTAGQGAPRFLLEISDWFRLRADEKSLMICEFRDFGIVKPGGVRNDIAKIVADAVVGGLSYAMVRPFVDVRQQNANLPAPILRFLSLLQENLTETYLIILKSALDSVIENEPKENWNNKIDEVLQRLKLYTRATDNSNACPGLGYRLFYTETRTNRPDPEPFGGKLWDWVSGDEDDHLVERKSASTSELECTIDAVSCRFFPLIECWHVLDRLPHDTAEIQTNARRLEADWLYGTRHGIDVGQESWGVVQPPQSLIDKYREGKIQAKKPAENND